MGVEDEFLSGEIARCFFFPSFLRVDQWKSCSLFLDKSAHDTHTSNINIGHRLPRRDDEIESRKHKENREKQAVGS